MQVIKKCQFLLKIFLPVALWLVVVLGVSPYAKATTYTVNATGALATNTDDTISFAGAYTLTRTIAAAGTLATVNFANTASTFLINTTANAASDLSAVTFSGNTANSAHTAGTVRITSTGLVTLGTFADGTNTGGNATKGKVNNLILDANTNVTTADLVISNQITLGGNATLTVGNGFYVGIDRKSVV